MEQDQLTILRKVFDKKQQLMDMVTRELAEILTPTLLTALFELMELSHEEVAWEDFSLQDDALVIRVQVQYSPADNTSLFLGSLIPPDANEDVVSATHRIIFGVPLDVVFMEKDELKRWCLDVVLKQTNGTTTAEEVSQVPALTEDQLLQILHFQRMYTTEQ